jgi:hypothetical protein
MVCPVCITTAIASISAPIAITAVSAIAAIKLKQIQVKERREQTRLLKKNNSLYEYKK